VHVLDRQPLFLGEREERLRDRSYPGDEVLRDAVADEIRRADPVEGAAQRVDERCVAGIGVEAGDVQYGECAHGLSL
jgi:hypothetical protein